MTTLTSLPFADQVTSAVKHATAADGWRRCFDELFDMKRLEDDWDGCGAYAPKPEHVDSALRLAFALSRSPGFDPPLRATVAPDGSVHIEWQEAGAIAALEVTGPGEGEMMVLVEGKPPEHAKIRW